MSCITYIGGDGNPPIGRPAPPVFEVDAHRRRFGPAIPAQGAWPGFVLKAASPTENSVPRKKKYDFHFRFARWNAFHYRGEPKARLAAAQLPFGSIVRSVRAIAPCRLLERVPGAAPCGAGRFSESPFDKEGRYAARGAVVVWFEGDWRTIGFSFLARRAVMTDEAVGKMDDREWVRLAGMASDYVRTMVAAGGRRMKPGIRCGTTWLASS